MGTLFGRLFESKEGFQNACDAKKMLDSCINDPTAKKCFTPDNMEKVGFTESEALAIASTYLQLEYVCGPLFESKCLETSSKTNI